MTTEDIIAIIKAGKPEITLELDQPAWSSIRHLKDGNGQYLQSFIANKNGEPAEDFLGFKIKIVDEKVFRLCYQFKDNTRLDFNLTYPL